MSSPFYKQDFLTQSQRSQEQIRQLKRSYPTDKPTNVVYDPKNYIRQPQLFNVQQQQQQNQYGGNRRLQDDNPFKLVSQGILQQSHPSFLQKSHDFGQNQNYSQSSKSQYISPSFFNQNSNAAAAAAVVHQQEQLKKQIESYLSNQASLHQSPSKRADALNSVTIRGKEWENRQYSLSENDSVEGMREFSKMLRSLKEKVVNSRDPSKQIDLKRAVERRILAKTYQVNNQQLLFLSCNSYILSLFLEQDERKQKIRAILSIDTLESYNKSPMLSNQSRYQR